jgi:hypothetical protein
VVGGAKRAASRGGWGRGVKGDETIVAK